MSLDFGSGVSRTLSPQDRAFAAVVWQKGKPPLDSELGLMASVDWERFRQNVAALMPSGFLMDPTRSEFDYKFDPDWINHFHLGVPRTPRGTHDGEETQPVVWANVNGWIIPVAGTDITTTSGVLNVVKLYPPPERDIRVDFVFLEAWASIVQPNPSTTNKPTASTIWRYGNTKFGGTNVTDDLEDPTIGIETTKRVQVQYRIRVYGSGVGQGAGVNLATHPDGLDDTNILGQGAASSPVAGFQWSNMREALADPSLWRAGDGDSNNDLGTIDGYTYAIPICAVFRRNSGTYVAIKSSGNPNQNGAFLRQPGAKLMPDPLDGAIVLLDATLGEHLSPDAGKIVAAEVLVMNLSGSGLEDTALVLSSTFLRLGDEIAGISAVNLNTSKITIPAGGRGRWGTAATGHDTGTPVEFFNTRPDGLFADEIAAPDVLDLRRAVNPGDWDFNRLLAHNVAALAKGTLRTAWKVSNPGDTAGPVVHEVADLYAANNTIPNHTDAVDGPDGIRTIWSDAATIQPDVTLLLDHEATQDADGTVGFTTPTFDATVEWDVGADFKPIGFLNRGAGGSPGWTNGSSIHLFIGGTTGENGARGTFRSAGVRDVRFVTPNEFWKSGYPVVDPTNGNQHPVTLRFLGEKAYQAPPANLSDAEKAKYGGPLYPWRESRFERPFLVLGGLLHSTLRLTGVPVAQLGTQLNPLTGATQYTINLLAAGLNFDAPGTFYPVAGVTIDDPSVVAVPLLRGEHTLFGMLTNHGRDQSGASSEVYLLTYGDGTGTNNNGAFRVIGAGVAGYTENNGLASAGTLVLEPLSADFAGWDVTGNTITVDFRSQYHNADDISNYQVASRQADLVMVLTDIGGQALTGTPWDLSVADTLALPLDAGRRTAMSKAVLSVSLLYHPGRSATTRVPDEFIRFAMQGGSEETIGTYLRRSPSSIDTTFSAVGTATDETYWDPVHIQTWNRLSALGWHAPLAPAYGGDVVGFTEADREHECFVDRGSKTVLFRPFRNRDMTLEALTWTEFGAGQCLLGSYLYPDATAKDALHILTGTNGVEDTSGKRMGFIIPQEFAPRFGRQDTPYRVLNLGTVPTSSGFMPGINHLFTDVTDLTSTVFNIIGGEANAGGTEVNPLFFLTRASEVPYAHPNSSYGPNGVGVYGARKTTDIDPTTGQNARDVIAALKAVNSSDLGRGLKGIQLPPYVGIARLYGVYEFEDYINKGGTAFKVNRYEMEANSAVNLLREDADQQTLYILQDGAKDFTTEVNDHTYIIPSNVLDLTRVPAAPGQHAGYVEGSTVFEDFDYVIEATVFFFAKGFINKNNIVLCRKRNGSFGLNTDGDDPELENVKMCLPCPAGVNDHFYMAYNRTVYQGDPFMTRDGTSRQDADYENRYGRLAPSQAWLLRTAVQQYDSAGNFVPQMSNPRGFEVLASMDFYTTLGTGKIGGAVFPGTPLDVGFIDARELGGLPRTRMPLTEDANDWRVSPRAFTEGQKGNTSRARATLEILNNQSLIDANDPATDAFRVQVRLLDESVVNLYGATAVFIPTLLGVPYNIPAEDIFLLDETREPHDIVYRQNGINFGTLSMRRGDLALWVTFTPSVLVHSEVADLPAGASAKPVAVTVTPTVINWGNEFGAVVFDGLYDPMSGDITVRASWMPSVMPFSLPSGVNDPGDLRNVRGVDLDFPVVAAGGQESLPVVWVGADPAEPNVVVVSPEAPIPGLVATGEVTGVDQVTITLHNYTGAPSPDPPLNIFNIALLTDIDPALFDIDLSDVNLIVGLSWEAGSKTVTADNLVACINAHSQLQRTLKVFNDGTPKVTIEAVPVGDEGNGVRVTLGRIGFPGGGAGPPAPLPLAQTFRLEVPFNNVLPVDHQTASTNLFGGVNIPVNAGVGTSQMALTGMTERLPLGVLVQDSDFLCENPLGDTASAMNSSPSPLRPIQTLMPLTIGGEEYSRFMGAPGELVALADVQIAPYSWAAWTDTSGDSATKKFRLYRGGGAAFVLSGDNPGGPLDWVSESFPASSLPVLKSGVLACRAMLVRNFYEEALPAEGMAVTSQGDEVQLVILTSAIMGAGLSEEALVLDGIISPSGYGEGYTAADRYRCMGRPMVRGYSREVSDPAVVTLAVYPEDQRGQ